MLRTVDIFRTYRTLQSRGVRFHSPPMRVFGDEITSGYSADLEDPDVGICAIPPQIPAPSAACDIRQRNSGWVATGRNDAS